MSEDAADRSTEARDRLVALARQVGDDWRDAPYFQSAEALFDDQWSRHVWPMIYDADFSSVVDLAAGHGRNSARLVRLAGTLVIVDINDENVQSCRRRFAHETTVTYLRNDGTSLAGVPDGSVSLVYCFDAMVHFDSDVVRAYLADARRVLRLGGRGFFHHSNFSRNPLGDVHENGGWRNFMSLDLFAHLCHKEGLAVLRQRAIDWGGRPESDGLTLVEQALDRRPSSPPDRSPEDLDALIMEARARGDRETAETLLRQARRQQPGSALVALSLGQLLAEAQRDVEAAGEFARAASLAPASATAHAHCARALVRLGRLQDASLAVARALALDPDEAIALAVRRILKEP
jgi:SAM-dependent methyltransferase